MARSRNIKPGFFKDEQLVDLPFEYRLLAIGLWTLADREGRLEDRPKRIKMELFPVDDISLEDGLNALAGIGNIVRYEVGDRKYIQITNFIKHQNPHHMEVPSVIPPPEGLSNEYNASPVAKARREQITKCARVDHKPSSTRAQVDDASNTTGSILLVTDSLIPDSLIPDCLGKALPGKPAKTRRTSYPDDFYPDETGIAKATESNVPISQELERFKDYHRGKGNTMADWQSAWRTWVGNAVKFSKGKANGQGFISERDRERKRVMRELTGYDADAIKGVSTRIN